VLVLQLVRSVSASIDYVLIVFFIVIVIVMAGARYWSHCNAVQAELAGAAFLTRALHDILANSVGPLFVTGVPSVDVADGLEQLKGTLSSDNLGRVFLVICM